ncbi:MAG TPA: hypothetical protein VG408_05740 [Actinomycetota bacterium]|nr:hypothetical protein [Actinomycetota bacterium]
MAARRDRTFCSGAVVGRVLLALAITTPLAALVTVGVLVPFIDVLVFVALFRGGLLVSFVPAVVVLVPIVFMTVIVVVLGTFTAVGLVRPLLPLPVIVGWSIVVVTDLGQCLGNAGSDPDRESNDQGGQAPAEGGDRQTVS